MIAPMLSRRLFIALAAFTLAPFTMLAEAPGGTIRVACVGDSITYGSGVAEREKNCYPAVLGQLLGAGYEVKNFGVSGATLLKNGDKPYWKQGAFQAATDFAPQIVVIKLGTNDTKPQNWKRKEEFAGDLAAMVEQFAGLPSKPKVWLCLPVPVHRANFGINAPGLDEAMALIRQVAAEKKTGLIDLHAALLPHPELFKDGIHPNAEGAALIAKAVNEALAAKVGSAPK